MGLRLEKRGEEMGWGREEMGGWEEMTFLLCTLVEARVGICVAYISDRPDQEGTRPGPSGSTVSGAEGLQCGAGCSLVFSELR